MKEMEIGVDKRIDAAKNKLKQDKRVLERQNKAMKNLPNRKEREDIEKLNKKVKQLEENLKIKEQRNKLTIERLKKQINEQKKRSDELKEERDAVSQAIKGDNFEEDKQQEVNNNYQNEEVQDSHIIQNSNNTQNWKRPQQINFYEPVNEDRKENDITD